jgi:hypothetical protein
MEGFQKKLALYYQSIYSFCILHSKQGCHPLARIKFLERPDLVSVPPNETFHYERGLSEPPVTLNTHRCDRKRDRYVAMRAEWR